MIRQVQSVIETAADPYFVKKDAARYSSLSTRRLDYAKSRGELPFYRVGSRKILFRRSDLDSWLGQMRVDLTEQAVSSHPQRAGIAKGGN